VGGEPTKEQKQYYKLAYDWLYDAINTVRAGTTTREIALKFPSAKELWGYEEEEQAAANMWGHGLGLAQYDLPVVSRIYSLDGPVTIEEGMSFALETQHGKLFEWGVRLEEMLIATKTGAEVLTRFPIEEITVCS
jgi:Xaa-Pro dipeptidase